MYSTGSPFRAGFGKTPPLLAGRDQLIRDFDAVLEAGAWGQERVTLIEGLRGVGKTVTLNALEDVAKNRGWQIVSETATPGFYSRIVQRLVAISEAIAPEAKRRWTGVGVAGFTIQTSLVSQHHVTEVTLREALHTITELITPRGVLITLDEVNRTSAADLQQLATDVQHAIREDQEVAVIASGLGSGIAELLSAKSLTFLRRAARVQLDLLSFDDTLEAIGEPIRQFGREISSEDLDYAARATQGYPFLVQLIGDLAWKANPSITRITLPDVQQAFRMARRTMGRNIYEPSLRDLSDTDRTVLAYMAAVPGPSAVADLRERLGVDAKYMSVYRQRLIDAGVVFPVSRGRIDIALPYLREYLKDHVVTEAAERARRRAAFPSPPELA